ncbi:MAG: PilN domain-containing protein [Planctomycetota bacterium]|jgi:Tfp pilus assembly protein PilN
MVNINFMPDEYVQSNESNRINLLYLILLAVVVMAFGCLVMAVKTRRHAYELEEKFINAKIATVQEGIMQSEEFHAKRADMMKTAATTMELLEPIPRSILLALLTNNLPSGVSFLQLELIQKEPKIPSSSKNKADSKYAAEKAKKKAESESSVSKEKLLETHISIEGIAPSDIQVATYLERLGRANLLDNVELVESKEYKIKSRSTSAAAGRGNSRVSDAKTFRQFKLTAMLKKNVRLTKDDITQMRAKL